MTSRTLTCNRCGHVPAPAALLAGVVAWWPWLNSAWHICARCGRGEYVAPGSRA